MARFSQILASGLLLAGTALAAGCSNSASGLITGTTANADAPGGITNEGPLARPIGVAWTSARAQRCGFYFDATKLRASYLAFEAKQSNAEEFAKAEKSYDSTYKVIRERVAADPDYCTDSKGAEIKGNLQRHLAGDFAPNFPKAKKVESCSWLGCNDGATTEAWDSKKFWEDQAKKSPK